MSSGPPSSIARQLFRLAAPIIGINVLAVTMLAVDMAVCGRLPNSANALASLSFAVQFVFLLMVAMMGLTIGTVAVVARAYGAGNTDRVNHVLVQSTTMTVILAVTVAIVGAVAARPILLVMGASHDVVDIGVRYLRPLLIGTPFYYLAILYAGVLRGIGNTRIPFLCALGANLVNFVLNYALVLGKLGMPSLGVRGAAIGTVTAQLVNVVALVAIIRRGTIPKLHLPLKLTRLDRALVRELLRVGWPAALDMIILNVGFIAALGMLGRIDEVAVAAHGVGLRVQGLALVPGFAVSQATGAMIGQALGAGSVERAREIARASMLLSTVIMSAIALVLVLAARPILGVFDVAPGSPLEHYSLQWMYMLAAIMPPSGVNVALVGVLQGAGATKTSLRINYVSTLAIQVPLAFLLGFALDMGAVGVWASFLVQFSTRAALCYVAYRRGRWAVTGSRTA